MMFDFLKTIINIIISEKRIELQEEIRKKRGLRPNMWLHK